MAEAIKITTKLNFYTNHGSYYKSRRLAQIKTEPEGYILSSLKQNLKQTRKEINSMTCILNEFSFNLYSKLIYRIRALIQERFRWIIRSALQNMGDRNSWNDGKSAQILKPRTMNRDKFRQRKGRKCKVQYQTKAKRLVIMEHVNSKRQNRLVTTCHHAQMKFATEIRPKWKSP